MSTTVLKLEVEEIGNEGPYYFRTSSPQMAQYAAKSDINAKYIYFHNDTHLPVMMEAWVDGSSRMHEARIAAGEKAVVHSSVGEWHLTSMFDDPADRDAWLSHFGRNEMGFGKYTFVGKFRSQPSAFGDYAWPEYDAFQLKHTVEEPDSQGITGRMTYSLVMDSDYVMK